MNQDQYGSYGPQRPGVPPPPPPPPPPPAGPLPAFAVPPPQKRGKGCLYAAIGCVATLFLLMSCTAIVASSGTSGPGTTYGGAPATAPAEGAAGGGKDGAGDGKDGAQSEAKSGGKDDEKAVTDGVGREYRDGKFAFTVTKVKKGVRKVGNDMFGDTAQGRFVFIHVTVKNIGDEARNFTHHNQTLIDTEGRKFEADPEASLWSEQKTNSFLQQINPGNSVKGTLIYDVPRGTKLKAIELHDSMFSGGVTVPLAGR